MHRIGFSVGLGLIAASGCFLGNGSAQAASQVFEYAVEHPTYGDIGTYTNIVQQQGAATDIRTELHIQVKMLGVQVFHQDADRKEHWEDGRLVSFQSATDDNGKDIHVVGKAQGENFVITSPAGTVNAPGQVHPSNPWSPAVLKTDVMMSTKNGRIQPVTVKDTGDVTVTFDGRKMTVHQYFIDSDKHQIVWFDDKGTVVAFQTEENGSQVNFVLKNSATASAK
jgi:hypothetical protein